MAAKKAPAKAPPKQAPAKAAVTGPTARPRTAYQDRLYAWTTLRNAHIQKRNIPFEERGLPPLGPYPMPEEDE